MNDFKCETCLNFRRLKLKFKVRARVDMPYSIKEFTFDRGCIFNFDKKIKDAIILDCSEYKEIKEGYVAARKDGSHYVENYDGRSI